MLFRSVPVAGPATGTAPDGGANGKAKSEGDVIDAEVVEDDKKKS